MIKDASCRVMVAEMSAVDAIRTLVDAFDGLRAENDRLRRTVESLKSELARHSTTEVTK